MTDAIAHHPPIADLAERLARARAATRASEIDALLISPGPDLRYLTGYDALPLERLTCLVVRADGDPMVVVPGLEQPATAASPIGELGLEILTWGETDDPYALLVRGQSLYYKPRAFGGDVAEAQRTFERLRGVLGRTATPGLHPFEAEVWVWMCVRRQNAAQGRALQQRLLARRPPPLFRQFLVDPP